MTRLIMSATIINKLSAISNNIKEKYIYYYIHPIALIHVILYQPAMHPTGEIFALNSKYIEKKWTFFQIGTGFFFCFKISSFDRKLVIKLNRNISQKLCARRPE